jgi:hypothetical protein
MLDSTITELADRMIQFQFHERSKQLAHDILLAQNDAAMRGMGTSSSLVDIVYDICARDVELRALIVWQNLMRVLSHAGTVPSATLADELKQAVSKYESAIYVDPDDHLQAVARSAGFKPRESLMDARDRAVRKVYAEIDLFVLGLARCEQSQSNPSGAVYHFYSPVGAVQTGPNASAQVFQNVTTQDRETFLSALSLLRKALASVDRLPAHPKEEIVELVDEAEAEIKKSKPNNSKLLSTFMIIAQAIQTVGSLKPAYDALKAALLPLGIALP